MTLSRKVVPTYALYGEFLSNVHGDLVHHETIQERSREHDWDIQMHRHKALLQVFVFRSDGIVVRLGDEVFVTTGAVAICIPPMVIHGFTFQDTVDGDVLSFPIETVTQDRALVVQEAQSAVDFRMISECAAHLAHAFRTLDADRDAVIGHLREVLLMYFSANARRLGALGAGSLGRALSQDEKYAQVFCSQIEEDFARSLGVEEYAFELGISAQRLTRATRRVMDASPNELITSRRMIEAERLLKFTRYSIDEVANRSGYRDGSYFNRAFKKVHGTSPGRYRRVASVD